MGHLVRRFVRMQTPRCHGILVVAVTRRGRTVARLIVSGLEPVRYRNTVPARGHLIVRAHLLAHDLTTLLRCEEHEATLGCQRALLQVEHPDIVHVRVFVGG